MRGKLFQHRRTCSLPFKVFREEKAVTFWREPTDVSPGQLHGLSCPVHRLDKRFHLSLSSFVQEMRGSLRWLLGEPGGAGMGEGSIWQAAPHLSYF